MDFCFEIAMDLKLSLSKSKRDSAMREFFHIIFSTEKTGAIAAALFHLLCKTDNLETLLITGAMKLSP